LENSRSSAAGILDGVGKGSSASPHDYRSQKRGNSTSRRVRRAGLVILDYTITL